MVDPGAPVDLLKNGVVAGTKHTMQGNTGARHPAARTAIQVAVALASCLAATPAALAGAADCPLAVSVAGSEPARTSIADELARAGVGAAPIPGCTAETVVVTAQGPALELTITDPYGRVTRRTVADLRAASALIQSTPGADALQPLLPEADLPIARPILRADDASADEVPTPPTEMQPRAAGVVSAAALVDRPPARGVSLLMAPELALGSDGSRWAGLSIAGCVTLGSACVGTRVRFWSDLAPEQESNNTIHQRTAGEIALSLDFPFTWHRVEFRPGAEMGLLWVHMGQLAVPTQAGDDGDLDQGEVLAGLNLGASYPLSKHWALEASVGAALSLFAHQTVFTVQGAQLPGEPLAFGIATLGVRYGSP